MGGRSLVLLVMAKPTHNKQTNTLTDSITQLTQYNNHKEAKRKLTTVNINDVL